MACWLFVAHSANFVSRWWLDRDSQNISLCKGFWMSWLLTLLPSEWSDLGLILRRWSFSSTVSPYPPRHCFRPDPKHTLLIDIPSGIKTVSGHPNSDNRFATSVTYNSVLHDETHCAWLGLYFFAQQSVYMELCNMQNSFCILVRLIWRSDLSSNVTLHKSLELSEEIREHSNPTWSVIKGVSLSPGCGATFGDSANSRSCLGKIALNVVSLFTEEFHFFMLTGALGFNMAALKSSFFWIENKPELSGIRGSLACGAAEINKLLLLMDTGCLSCTLKTMSEGIALRRILSIEACLFEPFVDLVRNKLRLQGW